MVALLLAREERRLVDGRTSGGGCGSASGGDGDADAARLRRAVALGTCEDALLVAVLFFSLALSRRAGIVAGAAPLELSCSAEPRLSMMARWSQARFCLNLSSCDTTPSLLLT